MVILKTSRTVAVHDTMTLWPFTRYVVPDSIGHQAIEFLRGKQTAVEASSFNSYERRFSGSAKEGQSVLLYRHDAYGDQLMATAIPSIIMRRNFDVRVDVCCSSGVMDIWKGLPVEVIPAPMLFEAVVGYNYHIMYDSMLEANSERDQNNCYDDLLAWVGIDPTTVEPQEKRPQIRLIPSDTQELEAMGFDFNRPFVLIQLGAANPNRSYPYENTLRLIEMLSEKIGVILVGKEPDPSKTALFGPRNNFLNLVNNIKSFRSLLPLIAFAKCVVCPDSSVGHAAAAFPKVPVVSLWGLFDPNDRVKYYENHHPIFPKEICPHAPCRNHEFQLPQTKCKDATNSTLGPQKYCNVLKSITPEEIFKKVVSLI